MSMADKLSTIAENEQKVYDAGRKKEWSDFWDAYQRKGTLQSHERAYVGVYFNFDNFYPKYDIRPVGRANQIFYAWEQSRQANIGYFKQRLEECGVTLDLSQATYISSAFSYCGGFLDGLPTIDLTGLVEAVPMEIFSYARHMKSIDKIIVRQDTGFYKWFTEDEALETVIFEGTIGQNGLNLQWSTNLTHESLMSIINCLADYSADTSGTVWTVTLGEANIAKLTSAEQQIAYDKGWNLG